MGLLNINSPKNLLAWNEELNRNPPWVPVRCTVPSINNASPQVGNNSAAILHEDVTAASTHQVGQNINVGYNRIYTLSCYAKPINRTWILLNVYQGFAGLANAYAYFNLTTGSVGTTLNIITSGVITQSSGWFRVYFAYLSAYSAIKSAIIYSAAGDALAGYNGLDQDSLYVWRPQLNEGYYPDDSFATREVPIT